MSYDKSEIERVKAGSDIRNFVPDLKGRGASQYCKCPECGAEGKNKGLIVTHKGNKNIAKCLSCGFSFADSISAYQFYNHTNFIDSLKAVAQQSGIPIESEKERRARTMRENMQRMQRSFCEKQLDASGLTFEDVTATVTIDNGKMWVQTFRKGSIDRNGNINESDDEMLIYYYDLNGQPMTYTRRGSNKLHPYVRVRWSNPAAHKNIDGKETKYYTPKGASTRLYIPQKIRDAYQKAQHIDTLIVQEGEKKAEKACKHGIMSVGIQGIFNIGNEETGLIRDLQYIAQTCTVRRIILMFDSDWNHLSSDLQPYDHVDYRPNAFSKAAIKFKTYIQTLHSINVNVDVYFGHIKETPTGEKGIDDLLVGTLKDSEDALLTDIEKTLLTHDGLGEYVNIYKITTKTDLQIRDYWGLTDPTKFFEQHEEQLKQLTTFRFAQMTYKVEDGKISLTSKTSEKEFWKVYTDEKEKRQIEFDAYEALEFITANGFHRIHTEDLGHDDYKFVRIVDNVVHLSGPTEIRDFIYYYVLQSTKEADVRNYFATRLGNLLSQDKLERLYKVEDSFDNFEPHIQREYYLNGQISVTSQNIDFSETILGNVWADKIISRKFRRVPIIANIQKKEDGTYEFYETEAAAHCEFLRYLQNTSNFWSAPGYNATEQDNREYCQHLVNKLTSIGFLLTDYKFQTEQKAVIAMDGQLGDVGQSNGRTGKSILGKALSYILEQTYIDGRNTKNDDEFLYSNVSLRTRNIFLDDVKERFDFERFFGALTGDLAVNPKGKERFIIKNETSPKFYITTNHAINAISRSARDRITYLAFSDWYNDYHTPMDDFHHQFFVDWDDEQWNLFDNLMAECIMYYLRSMTEQWERPGRGAVSPPMRDINKRTLKQLMGEAFYQWAEIYFDESAGHINERIERKLMYDAFHSAFPDARFGVTPANFKKKLEFYCQFKNYHLNPSKRNKSGQLYGDYRKELHEEVFIGEADKSGGKEYLTVMNANTADKQPF